MILTLAEIVAPSGRVQESRSSRNCCLFSSDDNGHLYRSWTTLSSISKGIDNAVIARLEFDKHNLLEAFNVYNLGNSQCLLMVEAIGSDG